MKSVDDLLHAARDAMTVKRVFGDPVERDGVTVIPVASITGGWGGGGASATGESPASEGYGGGFGMYARPAGVYVIRGENVTWQPATNPERAIIAGQAIAIAALVTLRVLARARGKRTGRGAS